MTPFGVIASGRVCQYWLAVAFLLAIVLRALIPAGFMPGASGLEFCSGGIPTPMLASAGHAHHHDRTGSPSGSSGHADGCVFAGSAAGLAPPPAPAAIAKLPAWIVALYVPASAVTSASPLLRAQSPRGPHALS